MVFAYGNGLLKNNCNNFLIKPLKKQHKPRTQAARDFLMPIYFLIKKKLQGYKIWH